MQVLPNGARASVTGPVANFTGRVTVMPLFAANEYSNATSGQVEFTPGALQLAHASGRADADGQSRPGLGSARRRRKDRYQTGRVIYTPPGVSTGMARPPPAQLTHIAVSPMAQGKNVDWLEPVTTLSTIEEGPSDERNSRGPSPSAPSPRWRRDRATGPSRRYRWPPA